MILLGLLYHAYLYVFGFPSTRIRMSDGGVTLWVPEPYRKVVKRFGDALRGPPTLLPAHRYNRRMSRVVVNPMQVVYLEEVRAREFGDR